jgi:hypothetical protein
MRPARPLIVLALAAGLAVGAGCGSGDGTIPAGDAQQLRDGLERVRAAIEAGDCTEAEAQVTTVRSEIGALDVPARLRRNLAEGARKLDAAAGTDCKTATTPTQTTETQTTETQTVTVPTTETTTTAPPTTDTTTTPTTPTTEPTTTIVPPTGGVSPGDEQGNGDGNGGENK